MRILSIDDSKSVHAFLDACFAGSPHQLAHALDGDTGLSLLAQSASAPFGLVLLDWEMPVMSGPQVLAEMKERGFNMPVIMLTSKNNIENITQMLEMGVSEYIMKPFTADIVLAKVAIFNA